MELENLVRILEKSLEKLVNNDLYLLDVSTSVYSINHRLAMYLENEIRDTVENGNLLVDIQYNRRGDDTKRLEGSTVTPNIIIHNRRMNNCVVFECCAKKGLTSKKKMRLESFLKNMRHDERYKFAVALEYHNEYISSSIKVTISILNEFGVVVPVEVLSEYSKEIGGVAIK